MILELEGTMGVFLYNFFILHMNNLRLYNWIDKWIFQTVSTALYSNVFPPAYHELYVVFTQNHLDG